jgi:ubiquinone/menaquinone biosynthesis C-methylase UbiE
LLHVRADATFIIKIGEMMVDLNFINREQKFWDTTSLHKAKFDKIYVDPANNDKPKAQLDLLFEHSAIDSYNAILKDIPYTKEWKVLDIGCGIGRVIKPMRSYFQLVDGIDISQNMIDYSIKYLKDYTNGKTWKNNGFNILDAESNYYDFVYSLITFQHIHSRLVVNSYLRDIHRVLKYGGYFKLQVHDNTNPGFGSAEEEPSKDEPYGFTGNAYSEEEIKHIFEEHKFKVIKVENNSPWIWITGQRPEYEVSVMFKPDLDDPTREPHDEEPDLT